MNYRQEDLVRVAKRDHNTKRSYLVVDPLQAKHVPVSPAKALELFESLAESVREIYKDEKLLVIGFAETATAIGAQTAVTLGADYIQTTREVIPGAGYLFFSEEHSHATEQKLVREDVEKALESADRILFVEDEVTTGKTIRNIITVMRREFDKSIRFAVASLLNAVEGEALEWYEREGIPLHYLVKTDHSGFAKIADQVPGDGQYHEPDLSPAGEIACLEVKGAVNARRLCTAKQYTEGCLELWKQISGAFGAVTGRNILVVGTEECMYPALFVGRELEKAGNTVLTHSTTRSPICVDRDPSYPLHERYELRSLYDADRRTFLYDIAGYDLVLIVTDAVDPAKEKDAEDIGLRTLLHALGKQNQDIRLVRWCAE